MKNIEKGKKANRKLLDFSDLTILILVRLDSIERLENLFAVCRYLLSNVEANIWVSEYAWYNNGMLEKLLDEKIRYSFQECYDPVFYRNRYQNQLVRTITTPFVALWDADVIIPVTQLEKGVEILRKGDADLVNPYQEPMVDAISNLKSLFLQRGCTDIVSQNSKIPETQDLNTLFSGVILANRKAYLSSDLNNENFNDWDMGSNPQHYRWDNLNLKMQSISGNMFRLDHGSRRSLGKLILHYNTPEMTERLCRMVPGAIVIDNGSDEYPYKGTNRCIRQENLGFTEGWNRAIKTLWNEFDMFWLMNSDIVIDPESVKRVEWIAAAYPDVLFYTPAYNCWIRDSQPKDYTGLAGTPLMEFTAPVISKNVFEKIGFFDNLFSKGYGVDFDYCFRARQAGIQIYVDHYSCFYHLEHQTIERHEGFMQYSKNASQEMEAGLSQKYGSDYKTLIFRDVL